MPCAGSNWGLTALEPLAVTPPLVTLPHPDADVPCESTVRDVHAVAASTPHEASLAVPGHR
jgi:hypothetical protein